jgi:hypothetical protein
VKTLSDVAHPLLYKQLLLLRDEICNDEHKPIYMVANSKSLKELTEFLQSKGFRYKAVRGIRGFSIAKLTTYSRDF